VVFGGSVLIKGRLLYFTTSVHLNDGPIRGVVFGGSDLIKGRLLYFTTLLKFLFQTRTMETVRSLELWENYFGILELGSQEESRDLNNLKVITV
jgi:hypothetical protein